MSSNLCRSVGYILLVCVSRYNDWLLAGGFKVRIPGKTRNFLFSETLQTGSGSTEPTVQWISEILPGIKRPEHESDHSPPSSGEVKNQCRSTSAPLVCFHGVDRGVSPSIVPC
jgi:hypothetical protein